MIVVDASVLAPALADDSADGDSARAALRGDRLIAPELIDLEIISVWRKQVAIGQLVPTRADSARDDLRSLPMERISHRDVIERCWGSGRISRPMTRRMSLSPKPSMPSWSQPMAGSRMPPVFGAASNCFAHLRPVSEIRPTSKAWPAAKAMPWSAPPLGTGSS